MPPRIDEVWGEEWDRDPGLDEDLCIVGVVQTHWTSASLPVKCGTG